MTRVTLIAVVAFGLLAAVALLHVGQHTERGISRISLAEIDAEQLDRVEIGGSNPVELTRDGDVWRLANGREAEPRLVSALIQSLSNLVSSDLMTRDPERFAEFEVDEAKGVPVVIYAGEKSLAAFVLGRKASSGVYVLVDGGVYKMTRLVPGVFTREAGDWLVKKVFTASLGQVERVHVRAKQQAPYVLVRSEGDGWELEDASVLPEGFRYDPVAAGQLVKRLLNLRLEAYVDEDLAVETTGLGEEADVVAFVLKAEEGEGVRKELRLGKKTEDGQVFASVVGTADIFTVAEPNARALRRPATDFRDLTLVKLDPDAIQRLSIVKEKQRLVLEKGEADWEVASSSEAVPEDFELDPGLVQGRLQNFASSKAAVLADSKALQTTGLGRPSATVTATLEDGSKVQLAFGKETQNGNVNVFYTKGALDDEVYWVTGYLHATLTGGLESFSKTAASEKFRGMDPEAISQLPPEIREAVLEQMKQQLEQ